MHHRDDEDRPRLGPIEKTVGKSTNENATETPGEPMTDLRVSRDGPCNASHFSDEFQSETRFTEALIEPFERRLRRAGP